MSFEALIVLGSSKICVLLCAAILSKWAVTGSRSVAGAARHDGITRASEGRHLTRPAWTRNKQISQHASK
jgi:hypothetical protein